MDDFPARLGALRECAQLSYFDLADRTGLDYLYLKKLEGRRRVDTPSEDVLRRIAHELASVLGKDEAELADEFIALIAKTPAESVEKSARTSPVMVAYSSDPLPRL